jgi:hypothetical protein
MHFQQSGRCFGDDVIIPHLDLNGEIGSKLDESRSIINSTIQRVPKISEHTMAKCLSADTMPHVWNYAWDIDVNSYPSLTQVETGPYETTVILLLFLTAIGFSPSGSSLTPVQTPQYNNTYINGTAQITVHVLPIHSHNTMCLHWYNIPT